MDGFEFDGGLVVKIGSMVEAALGQRDAEALAETQEQACDVNDFGREAVCMAAIAPQQAVPFELAEIIPELVESIFSRSLSGIAIPGE